MKVRDLIAQLMTLPGEAEVVIYSEPPGPYRAQPVECVTSEVGRIDERIRGPRSEFVLYEGDADLEAPIECIQLNERYLGQRARSDKDSLKLPGVRIYSEDVASVR